MFVFLSLALTQERFSAHCTDDSCVSTTTLVLLRIFSYK